MIKSMTGFASLTRDDERGAIGVTIRSVNHRFLDMQLRAAAVDRRSRAAASHDRPEAPGARPRRDQRLAATAAERGAADRAERGIRAGTVRRHRAGAQPRSRRRRADARRSSAAAAGADHSRDDAGVRRRVVDARHRRRRCGREPRWCSSRRCGCGRACTCAPISMRGRVCCRD